MQNDDKRSVKYEIILDCKRISDLFMKDRFFKSLSIFLCLSLFLASCENGSIASSYDPVSETALYHSDAAQVCAEYENGDVLYIDRTQIFDDGAFTSDQKKIMDVIQQHMRATASSRQGEVRIVDSDAISEIGLEHELDCRYLYLARESIEEDLSTCKMFVDYHQMDIREDAAKVVVSYRLQAPDEEQPAWEQTEAYIFKKYPHDATPWQLVNVIFDAEDDKGEIFAELENSQAASEWLTKFSFSQCQREDYTTQPNYSYYVDDDMKIDEAKFNNVTD